MEMGTVRFVKDDTVVSRALPQMTIRYSNKFIYLGNLQYLSHDARRVEAFIFIEPSATGHVASLLLLHFEGLLENHEGECQATGERAVELAGETYQYQHRLIQGPEEFSRATGTQLSLAADYIRQRAYTLAGDMLYHRFSRCVAPDRRSSISLTYLEASGGNHAGGQDSFQRALDSFEILP